MRRVGSTSLGFEVPAGWRAVLAADLASPMDYACVGGPFGSDLTTQHYVDFGVPVIRGANLTGRNRWMVEEGFVYVAEEKAEELRRNLAYPGDLVFTQRGTLGQVARIRPDSSHHRFVLSQSQMKLAVDPTISDPDFLYYFFASPLARTRIEQATVATGLPHINLGVLKAFAVPVPPIGEQRKIATILASVDDAIEAAQSVIDQLRIVKTAMIAALLTRGLPGRHTRFKRTEIGAVPEDWEMVPLSDIASVERGKFSHRPRNDPRFYGGAYPFIQTGDVAASGGRIRSFTQTLNDEGLGVSRLFPPGTIIITIAANIGDTGIAMFPVAFPDSLVGIQAGSRMDGRFLELVLRTRKEFLENAAPQNAQKNINLETLRPLVVQVPDLPEQREIADLVEEVDERLEAESNALTQLGLAKKALMSVLLTGELRVTPDEGAA